MKRSRAAAIGRQPRVSVVIASYRWPEALRLSLHTALAQTVSELEVLVIEDGSDLASRQVVEEADDRRVRWHALEPSCGSQAGPNEWGRRHAAAPVVAYLGHDDIWHPQHLAGLLATLARGRVDIAHAITFLFRWPTDSPEAAIPAKVEDWDIEVAGREAWRPEHFVPPSSVAHRRQSRRVARWPHPGEVGMPIDYEFLWLSHRRRARFATTGEPTVFKHASAQRPDSYVRRDVSPQRQLLDELDRTPDLGPRLLERLLASGANGNLPAPPRLRPGEFADYNRRMRGLPTRFGPARRSWSAGETTLTSGLHPTERDHRGSFAWTIGSERVSLRFDAPAGGRRLGVRVAVRAAVRQIELPSAMGPLEVQLDGAPVTLTEAAQDELRTFTGWLDRPAHGEVVEVALRSRIALPVSPSTRARRQALGSPLVRIELLQAPS